LALVLAMKQAATQAKATNIATTNKAMPKYVLCAS
jgi:hypothetical protein